MYFGVNYKIEKRDVYMKEFRMRYAVNKAFRNHTFREAGTDQEIDDVQDFVASIMKYFGCKPVRCFVDDINGDCFAVYCEFYDGEVKKETRFDIDFNLTNDELSQRLYKAYLAACKK